ncbi:MAG TPA: methyltransferase [Alphaproteobacteria bacterium]|nr:methyltransferase [Alphaproteobacteria bacterium]
MDLIFGRWRRQIFCAGVRLGVFDALAGSAAKSAADLAAELGLDAALLYRLLRALGSLGLLHEDRHRAFSLTAGGQLLRADHPQTLRGVVLLEEGPEHYAVWKHLCDPVREGKPDGFVREFGHPVFVHAVEDPGYGAVFNAAMSSYTSAETAVVLEALAGYDFSAISHICEVGGGHGYLHMMCATGGRERTEAEYAELFRRAGWRYVKTWYPASKLMGVVEARKA